ncbi:MAG: hypothetical protein VKJ06_06350 [Vampirovibrionales bacterium]|nr:hypothetical protein [Vampirovibrionales bacterium]
MMRDAIAANPESQPIPLAPVLIGVSGKQFAGKDTAAKLMQAALTQATSQTYGITPIALAIKQQYCKHHGLSLHTLEAYKAQHRPGLITLGTWGREQSALYWLQIALQPYFAGQSLIIPDVRLMQEYQALRQYGAVLLRVEATREIRAARGQLVSESDATETELDTPALDWDAVIENNGSPEAFEAAINTFVAAVLLPRVQVQAASGVLGAAPTPQER